TGSARPAAPTACCGCCPATRRRCATVAPATCSWGTWPVRARTCSGTCCCGRTPRTRPRSGCGWSRPAARPRACTERRGRPALHGHHFEIVLGHAAVRARPGLGNVFPARAGGDAVVRKSGSLVVDEAADDAHPA